jgi:hypothetical protein
MGFPAMSMSGFPGNRLDAYRAGMMPTMRMLGFASVVTFLTLVEPTVDKPTCYQRSHITSYRAPATGSWAASVDPPPGECHPPLKKHGFPLQCGQRLEI